MGTGPVAMLTHVVMLQEFADTTKLLFECLLLQGVRLLILKQEGQAQLIGWKVRRLGIYIKPVIIGLQQVVEGQGLIMIAQR